MAFDSVNSSLKERAAPLRQPWDLSCESICKIHPQYLDAYFDLRSVPLRNKHLTPKLQEFMLIAIDACTTHIYRPGIRSHIKAALELGATGQEIMEVIELTAAVGIHATNVGAPLLLEVLVEEGLKESATIPYDTRRERLKAEFIQKRGYWHPSWEPVIQVDPDFFEAYLGFSAVPWQRGALEPKVKELIYCAFDAATTHLYAPGLKLHIRNAVKYGATAGEIMEVLELATLMGVHGSFEAVPILLEEMSRQEGSKRGTNS